MVRAAHPRLPERASASIAIAAAVLWSGCGDPTAPRSGPDASREDALISNDTSVALIDGGPAMPSDAGSTCGAEVTILASGELSFPISVSRVDDDVVVAGYTARMEKERYGLHPFVLRIGPERRPRWAVEVGASPEEVRPLAAEDGGAFIAFTTEEGLSILRLTSDGALAWSRTMRSRGDAQLVGLATIDASGGEGDVLVTAPVRGSAGIDLIVARLTGHGELRWQRQIGGAGEDWPTGARLLRGGDAVVLGWSTSFVEGTYDGPFGTRAREVAWIVRLTPDGVVRAEHAFWLSDAVRPEPTLVLEAASGDLRVAGTVWRAGGLWGLHRPAWIATLDPEMNVTGSIVLEPPTSENVLPRSLAETERGDSLLLSETSTGAWLTTIAPGGRIVAHDDLHVGVGMAGTLDGARYTAVANACSGATPEARTFCSAPGTRLVLAALDVLGERVIAPPCFAPRVDAIAAAPDAAPARASELATHASVRDPALEVVSESIALVALGVEAEPHCFDPSCDGGAR